jgi:hypothetical protein
MKRYFLVLIAAAIPLVAYTEKTELRLAAGVSQIYICDSGPNAGGCYVQGFPVDAAHRAHVWPSIAGYNCGTDGDCTSVVNCTDEASVGVPCSILINREYGDIKLWSRVYLANDTSPGTWSSKLLIPGISAPCETATFVVPSEFHGFENKQICKTVSIAGGEDTTTLQLWMHVYNWRNGAVSVQAGTAAPVTFLDNPVLSFVCVVSNVCTIKTKYPHGYAAAQVVQFNGYLQGASGGASFSAAQINNTQTVQSVLDALTFTITQPVASCLGANCTFNSPDMRDNGITTQPFYYVNEDRWMGGLSGIRQAMEVSMPIPSGAIMAGTTNTIKWKFNNTNYPDTVFSGFFGGYMLRWNLVQPWQQITKITVTGNTTATVTLAGSVPAAWHNGDTVIMRDAPGPEWLFSHERVIGNISGSTFQFTITQPTVGSWTVPNGDYVVPTSKDLTIQTQPAAYAARALLPTTSFRALNPSTDYVTTGNAANGLTAVTTATLKQGWTDYFPNHASAGKCSSCHADTLYDLKYFSFPPDAAIVDGMSRGFTEQQAIDGATYIQSLAVPYVGRPWDPPYQPGIGLDSTPILNMAAGAGLQWKLNFDQDMRWFLVPGCTPTTSGCTGGSYAKFVNPGGSGGGGSSSIINTRELPTALQMPQWLRWLPMIAPEDLAKVTGRDFVASPAYATEYTTFKANTSTTTLSASLPNNCTQVTASIASGTNTHNGDYLQLLDLTYANKAEYVHIASGGGTTSPVLDRCQKSSSSQAWSGGEQVANFTVYWNTNGAYVNLFNDVSGECGAGCGSYGTPGATHYASFSRPEYTVSPSPCNGANCAGYWWPSMLPNAIVSAYDFGMVKTWDLAQTHYLYNMLDQVYIAYKGTTPNARAAAQDTRGFAFKWPFNRGPHKLVGGQNFLGNTGAISDRFFNCDTEIWYRLPGVIDNGNRMGGGDVEYDQNYYWAFFMGACGTTRPHFYDVAAIAGFLPQQMWGLAALSNMTLNMIQGVNQMRTGFWYNNLFTPDAEEAEVASQLAQALYNLSGINSQNTAQWQTQYNGGNCSTSSTTASNAAAGFNLDGCYLDELAYTLTLFTYYGTNSTLLSNIVAWLDPVWSAFSGAGHTLAKYTNATNVAAQCTKTNIGGHAPSSVSCTNPGLVWP